MERRYYTKTGALLFFLLSLPLTGFLVAQTPDRAQTVAVVAPGIWKVSYGTPEKHLPTQFKQPPLTGALEKLVGGVTPPFNLEEIRFGLTAEGVMVEMEVDSSERFYGFGLQTNAFEQRGLRREIRISSWTAGNIGLGHASMPFYISSKGYGVLVNSSRYTTFYVASKGKLDESIASGTAGEGTEKIVLSSLALQRKRYTPSNEVTMLVSGTQGVELLIIAGPEMKQVMQRYNLFSGGGALPPLWSLGFKYRAKATFTDEQVRQMGQYFRHKAIPLDMMGLEPGWQTMTYSCSFKWNPENFPDPDAFVKSMNESGFKLNLWEHAYTHPTSPIFRSIAPYSSNYTVWSGAVPDFITPTGREIFASYHEEHFVKKGISAFKLDECDAANFELAQREWSFPDIAQFPSGLDGVQMRQLYGSLYQKTLLDLYRKHNQRTMFDVRASYLFAAPFAAALYSDMYSHADFVRMTVNSGFAGVNWSPEVRETANEADLIRRLQSSLMSSHMVVNSWYLNLPPWLQYNVQKNEKHELLPNHRELEGKAKKLIELRMSLLPYLYACFARYHFEGIPPFRALVMDYPTDRNVWKIDDQYMMGESLLCAPFLDSTSTRTVYFPEGTWYDFNSGKPYQGGKSYIISMSLDEIPLFVKDNTILPLAQPVQFVTPATIFSLTCRVYGNPTSSVRLFEDNSYNFDYAKGAYNWVELSVRGKKGKVTRQGKYAQKLYQIKDWQWQ